MHVVEASLLAAMAQGIRRATCLRTLEHERCNVTALHARIAAEIRADARMEAEAAVKAELGALEFLKRKWTLQIIIACSANRKGSYGRPAGVYVY